MVKKRLARIMTVLLATTMLIGCSGNNGTKSGEKTKLTMSIWGGDSTVKMLEDRIAAFEDKNPGIDVELLSIPADYDQKIQTMMAGNTSPDVIQFAEQIHNYSSKNQLVNLNEYVKKDNLDLDAEFGDAHKLYTREGNLYGLPDRGGSMILFYNKDLFDKAGVEYPTGDWKWEELLAASQKLTVKEGNEVKQWGFAVGDWWCWWQMFIYQNGGGLVDDKGNVIIDSKENIEALQFYSDLVIKHGVSPSPADYQNAGLNLSGADPLFAQGKVAMELTGFWNIGALASAEGLNWDISTSFGGKKNAVAPFGTAFAIAEQSKNKDAAWKLVSFLSSEEGQAELVKTKEDVPANIKVMKSEEFQNIDFNGKKINMEVFEESATRLMEAKWEPWFGEVNNACTIQVVELLMGNIDAKQCVENMKTETERILKNY